jgi:hypothetical protein
LEIFYIDFFLLFKINDDEYKDIYTFKKSNNFLHLILFFFFFFFFFLKKKVFPMIKDNKASAFVGILYLN